MPFEPGKSGNPGGKSPEREAFRRESANYLATRALVHIKAIEELAENAESEKVRATCHIWCAEQVVGKAVQALSGPDGGPVVAPFDFSKLDGEELAMLDRIRKKLGQ